MMSSQPRPTLPSGILIHPAALPQQTWAEKCVCVCLVCCAPLGGCNVAGPMPSSVPSGILIHEVVWPQHNRHGPKSGRAAVSLLWEGSWVPSNTMPPVPRPTSLPSGILIHPTVWPQYTNVRDRQDRQT